MDTRTRIMTATAGAAALAGLAALARALQNGRLSGLIPSSAPTELHVAFDSNEWVVQIDGVDEAKGRYDTKRAALDDERAVAKQHAPSRLVIQRKDGSVQKRHEYLETAET